MGVAAWLGEPRVSRAPVTEGQKLVQATHCGVVGAAPTPG